LRLTKTGVDPSLDWDFQGSSFAAPITA
jgi:hypothetical protein